MTSSEESGDWHSPGCLAFCRQLPKWIKTAKSCNEFDWRGMIGDAKLVIVGMSWCMHDLLPWQRPGEDTTSILRASWSRLLKQSCDFWAASFKPLVDFYCLLAIVRQGSWERPTSKLDIDL